MLALSLWQPPGLDFYRRCLMTDRQDANMPCQTDHRLLELSRWCTDELNRMIGHSLQKNLEAVSGDASHRRYFRVYSNEPDQISVAKTWIAVDAPPGHEDCRPFVAIANSWRRQGLRTPEVLSVDYERGYMLLEDFGNLLLQYSLNDQTVNHFYSQALADLHLLQQTGIPDEYPLPTCDSAMLRREMDLFPEWCLKRLLGMTPGKPEQRLLETLSGHLVTSALEQPRVPVHRDYHSRNLMVLPDGLGMIDFQDAILGPATYDLVSLLRDCYIDWPQAQVYRWLEDFRTCSAVLSGHDATTVRRWFDWIGAQRHIKVLGIFARLWLRNDKPDYLQDMPRVLACLLWVCDHYPVLAEPADWLRREVQPRLAQQTWWQDYRLTDE